jgi:hypothetical protein
MRAAMLAATAIAVLSFAPAQAAGVIQGNGGKYMSPFTTDGTTAGWITKSMQVKGTAQIGSMAGAYAGQKVMGSVPFVGGYLGKKAGQKIGREVALSSIGGEEFLKSSSDQSFDSPQEMVDFIKANYSDREDLQKILQAVYAIYPDVQEAWPLARRPIDYGKPLAAHSPAAAGDLYRFNGKAGRVVTIDVQAEQMQPRVALNDSANKTFAAMAAPKGVKQLSFNATLPADGEYVVVVAPVTGFMKAAAGGGYTVKISDPIAEKEEADRLAAEAAAKKAKKTPGRKAVAKKKKT